MPLHFSPCELFFTPSDIDRFWSHVEKTDTCWFWRANIMANGYGHFWLHNHTVLVHRAAWTIANGPIPIGLLVLHKCESTCPPGNMAYRSCVCLDHLYLGTHAQNMVDMVATGRVAKGDRNTLHAHPERASHGEQNKRAKVSAAQVRQVRILHNRDGLTETAIGALFGITQTAVSCIVRRKSWQHID